MIPYHKRKTNRINLFRFSLSALKVLWELFVIWRYDVYYRLNVTGQVLSLQHFLNLRLEGADGKILIKGYDDQGIWVQLSTEEGEAYKVDASLASEDTPLEVALIGEIVQNNEIDFLFMPRQLLVFMSLKNGLTYTSWRAKNIK